MPSGPDRRAARVGLIDCTAGAAILEFALVLPLLVALALGAFELGRALHVSIVTEQAVRGGARYLARLTDPTCRPACPDGVLHAVRLTTDGIVENTGLPASAVRSGPSRSPPPGTVVMEAEVQLGLATFGSIGGTTWTVRASHQEERVAE